MPNTRAATISTAHLQVPSPTVNAQPQPKQPRAASGLVGDLVLWERGNKLGVEYRSNTSGDGPVKCVGCNADLPGQHKMCKSCHDAGVKYGPKNCSVCNMELDQSERGRKKVTLGGKKEAQMVAFREYLEREQPGLDLMAKCANDRDLRQTPVRGGVPLCNGKGCAFRLFNNAATSGKFTRKALRQRGRTKSEKPVGRPKQSFLEEAEKCHVCSDSLAETSRRRAAGGDFEVWEKYFVAEARMRDRVMVRFEKFSATTVICQVCYMRCYTGLKGKRANAQLAFNDMPPGFEGAVSYQKAAGREKEKADMLQSTLDMLQAGLGGPNADDIDFHGRQKIQVLFRTRVLRDFCGENEPTTLSELCDMLGDMIKEDDVCKGLGILQDKTPEGRWGRQNMKLLRRWGESSLNNIFATVPFWSRSIPSDDGRQRPVVIIPMAKNMPPVASMVTNMQERIDEEKRKIRELESLVAQLKADAKRRPGTDDRAIVQRSARILKEGVRIYGDECNSYVYQQASAEQDLEVDSPADEYAERVPRLLVDFLEELKHGDGDEEGDQEGMDVAENSRKCLIAGVLVSFARGTPFKFANITGIFLKEQGVSRRGIDWLARHLKITRTDNALWRLQDKLAKRLGSEAELSRLIPCDAKLVAVSYDNVNLVKRSQHQANGQINLASIGYYHTDRSEAPVAVLSEGGEPCHGTG